MNQNIFTLPAGQLHYKKTPNYIEIVSYEGDDIEIIIPDMIENLPVEKIQKKAFLSKKKVRKITLPVSLTEIGDWAFTYCDQLRQVVFPRKHLYIGKDIFSGAKHLQSITVLDSMEKLRDGIEYMLSASITAFGSYHLLNLEEAGNAEWMRMWDDRLVKMMKQDDFDGYADLLICGEEDYEGKDYDEISYPSRKRMGKVRMAFFRLFHDYELSEEMKLFLQEYLRTHSIGCLDIETWMVLKNEKSEDMDYFRIFADAGCITEKNIDKMINDLGEEQVQLRAALLNYKNDRIGFQNQFDEFEL